MTFPAEILPGQRLTANRLNAAVAMGRVVFLAFRDAAQSIATNINPQVANAISWDNVALDLLGGWSAANPTRYTPPIEGRYLLTGAVSFTSTANGTNRGAAWLVNETVVAAGTSRPMNTSAGSAVSAEARSIPVELDGDDFVQLVGIQQGDATLATNGGSNRPFISVMYVGPI